MTATAPAGDPPNVQPRARDADARFRFGRRLVVVEIAVTVAEIVLVLAPALSLATLSLQRSTQSLTIAAAIAGLMVLGWLRAGDLMRPVIAARNAKRAGRALTEKEIAATDRAIRRTPLELALSRWLLWSVAAIYTAFHLESLGFLPWPLAAGMAGISVLHAGGAAAARAAFWERGLDRARRLVLPNFDALKSFAAGYRRRLCQTAWALLAIAHAVNAALISVFTELSARQSGALLALTVPALLLPMLLWYASLRRRTRPIERYFEATLRPSRTRGPAREGPAAIAAFRAAQGLPYRLAGYQVLACSFAGVAVVIIGRKLFGFDASTAGRLLGASALILLAMGLYETLLLRDVLRPLLAQLGARHRLPVADIRSTITLRAKLVFFLASVTVFASGLVLLFALSPSRATSVMVGSIVLALSLAMGLVLLIVRDLVSPVRALEERSDEMARGELARPVPPSGEADEIGRLSLAFEEMRRALRDKLRSTESLNIDLEREVRRRTEVLEQRNAELHDALEKLRRAQDNLVRSEKLASMGRLVAGIAHEINNPVNAVINTLAPLEDTIKAMAAGRSDEAALRAAGEAQEMLRVVQRGAARSKAIVQALHNYSRGDEQRPRELVLERSIDDTLDLLRHRLRNVRVEKNIAPDLRLQGFPGQIDQVFMNLIANAAQAMGDRDAGGNIRIAAARRGDDVEITVADDGPGIPADVIGKIFDPFFTTKDVGEGSGLGLSIVHGIVDRHGGRIEVESRVGEGTTFRVVLPAGSKVASSAPAQP
jgi:signal transduction histidine kinase